MSEGTVCESCAQEIDPNDPTLVRAGLTREAVVHPVDDEPEVLFHAHCFPAESPVWVRR